VFVRDWSSADDDYETTVMGRLHSVQRVLEQMEGDIYLGWRYDYEEKFAQEEVDEDGETCSGTAEAQSNAEENG
jgi:hypothetical protein